MRFLAAALLLAGTSACGHAQQAPRYGLGAPLPEAVVDSVSRTIVNEINVWLIARITDERSSALVDSLATALQAAVRVTVAPHFKVYTFRWDNDLAVRQDSILAAVSRLPEVEEVSSGILLGVTDPGR